MAFPKDKKPTVSLIIVSYNGKKWLGRCLRSVQALEYPIHEVILVDNASKDGTIRFVQENFPFVKVLKNEANLGYAGGCNIGAQNASGYYVAFLNQDLVVDKNWLSRIVEPLSNLDIGACSGVFKDFDGNSLDIQYRNSNSKQRIEEIRYVGGAAFVTRFDLIKSVGLFDPYFFMYYEEIDWSWRLRLQGYKILCVSDAIVYHHVTGNKTVSEQTLFLNCRNRLRSIIKNCEYNTILSLTPLVFLEIFGSLLSIVYSPLTTLWFSDSPAGTQKGLILSRAELKGLLSNLQNLKDTLRERQIIQRHRVITDKLLNAKRQDYMYNKIMFLLTHGSVNE